MHSALSQPLPRLFLHTLGNTYVNDIGGKKKDQNAMQEKWPRSMFSSSPGQEPCSSNTLQCSAQKGPKSQIPLRGLDDLLGLFSSDILRFLQAQPQVSGADIKTGRREFWWSSGWDSALPTQGVYVRFLFRNWDPTCHEVWPKKIFFNWKKKKRSARSLS